MQSANCVTAEIEHARRAKEGAENYRRLLGELVAGNLYEDEDGLVKQATTEVHRMDMREKLLDAGHRLHAACQELERLCGGVTTNTQNHYRDCVPDGVTDVTTSNGAFPCCKLSAPSSVSGNATESTP